MDVLWFGFVWVGLVLLSFIWFGITWCCIVLFPLVHFRDMPENEGQREKDRQSEGTTQSWVLCYLDHYMPTSQTLPS